MQKYTDKKIIAGLKKSLSLSITKKESGERTASVALSKSGHIYFAGSVESDTNTFNLSSEQVALTLSAIDNDYKISKLVTMVEIAGSQTVISPLVIKIIKDHLIRTGTNIEYTIIDNEANILFASKNISAIIPYYQPKTISLSRSDQEPSPSVAKAKEGYKKNIKQLLKSFAIKGLNKNFPLYDSASGYATAVLTKSNKIFFAGQYSSPDKRLGTHSEVNAILNAFMHNDREITHIGLVSTKYIDSPCNMCGNCRQFISEMCNRYGCSPKLYLFAKDTEEYTEYNISTYLPSSWTSKKW